MFSLSTLVGTPRGSRLEFTPIGKRRPDKIETHEKQRMALNNDKINNSHMESTFEDTTEFDTLHSLDNQRNAPQMKIPGLFDGMFRPRDKIVSETSSIQELQCEIKELLAENYNLKIEVATLTKFLKQTPEEHRDLAYENVDLKQQLVRALKELDTRATSLSEEAAISSMRALYKEAIEEKDLEIRRLQNRVSDLDTQPQIPDEILDKMEFLQTENQSLRRKLDDLFQDSELAIQQENNNLKAQLHDLRHKYSLVPSDAADQLSRLASDCDTMQRKVNNLQKDLGESERENESLIRDKIELSRIKQSIESSLDSVRLKLGQREQDIDRLQQEVDALRAKGASSSVADNRLEDARRVIAELKATVKRLEAHTAREVEDKQFEVDRLSQKLSSLNQELKEKDKDESNLRSQVRSLMDERKSAFDTESTAKHYLAQIDTLRERERTLSDKNRILKDEVAKLQDELYSVNTNSSRAAKLKEETTHLQDKLDFYEKEYNLLQDALESAESDIEAFRSKEKRSDSQIRELERELEQLRTKHRQSEIAGAQKYNESALFELENLHTKRDSAERLRTDLQMEAMSFQIRKLERELELAKSNSHSVLDAEFHKILKERSRLQMEVDDKDLKIKENQIRQSKLESVMKDKEAVIEALESRIRDLNRDYKTNIFAEDTNKNELHKVRSDYEYQIRALQLENDSVQRGLEDQIRFFKNKLELVMERERHESVQPSAPSSIVVLLESQLEDARRLNNELSEKLSEQKNLRFDSERLKEDYKAKILELTAKYNGAQDEKLRLEDAVDALETESKIIRSEKSRLEMRAKNLAQELSKTSRHCTKLASKINEMDLVEYKNSYKNVDDALRAKKTNVQLQSQIEKLNSKLAAAHLSTPLPIKSRGGAETRLLRNELQYYKAKLFDLNLRANDLSLMNNFVMSSIRNSNQMIKNDVVKLAQCGVFPDYAEMDRRGGKLSLKVLATFVLSMVKIKRRAERAQNRNVKLLQLRGEIDREKITLLAE